MLVNTLTNLLPLLDQVGSLVVLQAVLSNFCLLRFPIAFSFLCNPAQFCHVYKYASVHLVSPTVSVIRSWFLRHSPSPSMRLLFHPRIVCSPSSNLTDLVLKFSAMTHWESRETAQPPRGKGLSPGTLALRTSYQVSLSTERCFIRGVTSITSFVCIADLGFC